MNPLPIVQHQNLLNPIEIHIGEAEWLFAIKHHSLGLRTVLKHNLLRVFINIPKVEPILNKEINESDERDVTLRESEFC